MLKYFYYRTLDQNGKNCYRLIEEAVKYFEDEVIISYKGNVSALLTAVSLDNPDLFYVAWEKLAIISDNDKHTIILHYLFDKKSLKKCRASVIKLLNSYIKESSDIWQTVKSVHDYAIDCLNRKIDILDFFPIELFSEKLASESIAKLFSLFLDKLHIESAIIKGGISKKDVAFAERTWNVIALDGKFYHLDILGDWQLSTDKLVRYDYFLLSDTEIAKSHFYVHHFGCLFDDNSYFKRNNSELATIEELEAFIKKQDSSFNYLYFKTVGALSELDESTLESVISSSAQETKGILSIITIMSNVKHSIKYVELVSLS